MSAFCGILRCGNRSDRDRKSYFRVPALITKGEKIKKQLSLERQRKWLAVLRRPGIDLDDEINKWLRVCEDHFITGTPADLFDVENPDWIPSLNLERKRKRINSLNISELGCESSHSDISSPASVKTESVTTRSVECQTDFTIDDLRAMENAYTDTIRELIEVRDKVSKLSVHEDAFRDNDLKTKNFTGIPSYAMLMTVFEMIEKDLPHYPASALTKFQRYMLTLMRLHLNLDLNDLSRRFCVSKSTILKSFQLTIHIMYQRFENVLAWPDRDKTKDKKVSVIVNTFEIITNKPLHAKHANTKKFLIGICPQNGIAFISSSYEGDTSDENILQSCGILENLMPGDVVICDKGASLHGDDTDDDTENQSDVHRYAERVIKRLKQYTFLQRTMPTAVLSSNDPDVPPLIDQVVKVCCCLINISALVDPLDEEE